ncbi:MAG: hypothetical protein JSS49_22260 [Planctomycetes bacterium]|nr:hypothetical protein [Planctomycetota bacterium]
MSTTAVRDAAFLVRFQSIWSRRRRAQLGQVLAGTALLALVGFGCVAAADYVWELDHSARLALLVVAIAGLVAYAGSALWLTFRQSGRPTTAAEIERAFPVLGQSVRTTVEFAGMGADQQKSEGVAQTLVTALTEQTHQRALPLTIEDVIPTRRLWILAAGAATSAVVLFGISASNWEWKNATQRVVLADSAYRTLEVKPGNITIDEGAGTQIDVALIGRTNREVVLFTRMADGEGKEWMERALNVHSGASSNPSSRPHVDLVAKLDRLTMPLEYQVVAGELKSPVFRIEIRHPLRIEQIKVGLTPPSYTRLPTTVTEDANISALQGTVAHFQVSFDKPVKEAAMILAPGRSDNEEPAEPVVVPLVASHPESEARPGSDPIATIWSATIPLTENRNYSIVAEAVDGTKLPETKHRIRVREDQPPQVTIESPNDAVEVHTLAELLMRIRLRDDYGLSKCGLIFQINNEQEIPLLGQDFEQAVAASHEIAAAGASSPTTQAALEKVLPLELFELTQKDSVMYFAFAEDNRPGSPQRTETDMRFIDIRPFKREYQVVDPDPMPGMGGAGLKTLEELIQRQRFGLNRTMQIEKRAAVGRSPDAMTVDQLMKYETDLATNVRETAAGLQARGFDDVDLFFQAEAAMLAAVDSLSVAKWENATLQMRDALKALIEQRDRTRLFLLKNPDPQLLAQLRQFDRLQAQKLRRPKTDKEEARELIQRLETLIAEENRVIETLSDQKPDPDPVPEQPSTEPSN